MLKTILVTLIVIFIILPFSISISTYLSILFMKIAIFLGGVAHKIFKGKGSKVWELPLWLNFAQLLIMQGIALGIIANIIGALFNWSWLSSTGSFLTNLSSSILIIDLVVLVILSTIYGRFEVME